MHIDILTIFPEMFAGPFSESIVKRAQEKNLVSINVHNLRDWADGKHSNTDDRPYGGGPGMVMMVEPIDKAINNLTNTVLPLHKGESEGVIRRKIVLTSASGKKFDQKKAQEYKNLDHLIIIAGHYEGVDQRVADHLVDESISIGDYVLTGGEIPAMIISDAVIRLLPGVLGDPESIVDESHSEEGYLEYPHYTVPRDYKGWTVPDVLLSGNHAAIATWRKEKSKSAV